MAGPVKKRPYVSPARRAKAEATRARIIDAATRLFLEAGYARTSTAAIGKAARTSEASVFAAFGSKADLLVAVVRDHVVRDSDFPLARQSIWRRFAAQPDKTPAIEAMARVARRAHDRSWRLLGVAAAAAQDDAAVAEAMGHAARGRWDDCEWFIREVIGIGDADDADRDADAMWTLISVENYRHLVVERSWPPERYEGWLATMLTAILR
jgi:AcrR family transcriptional regulator